MTTTRVKYYLACTVSLITFAVYLPALQNEFIGWDDGTYIVENAHIRLLNGALLKWAFFDFYASNWHPLTWLSHALDYAVWGLNPLGHHLTNNILHAVNTFLLVLLVARLIEAVLSRQPSSSQVAEWSNGRVVEWSSGTTQLLNYSTSSRFTLIAAATTGLLFGLHPLHVESVAWVSERKDLLCALFYLLSIMAYMRYAGSTFLSFPRLRFLNRYYLLSLCFFILALMSKPMAVSLPAVLLLLDWYPFERIRSLKTFLSAVVGKLPFIALSIGSSILTIMAQEKAMFLNEFVPLPARILVAVRTIFVYLGKMLLPVDLSPFYPYSDNVFLLSPGYYLPFLFFIGITAAFLYIGKRQKIWLSVWFYYIVTLLPVLGVVQVGRQSMADRYTYLPSIAPFLIVGLFAAWIYRKVYASGRSIKLACIVLVLCLSLFMSFLTYRQIGIWNNSAGFWSYVIEKEPEVPFAYYGRGVAFYEMGQTDKALEDYGKAIDLDPLDSLAYINRGAIFEKKGDFEKTISDYGKVVSLKPGDPDAHINLGVILEKIGRFSKAIEEYDRAIALDPSKADAYFNRGNAFDALGRLDKAIADYDKAIALNSRDSQAYNNRGLVFEKMGELDKAIADYDRAIALDPSNSEASNNLRSALEKKSGKPAGQGRAAGWKTTDGSTEPVLSSPKGSP